MAESTTPVKPVSEMATGEIYEEARSRGIDIAGKRKVEVIALVEEARKAEGVQPETPAQPTVADVPPTPGVETPPAEDNQVVPPVADTPVAGKPAGEEATPEAPSEETPPSEEAPAPAAEETPAPAKPTFACEVEGCGEVFDSSFDLSQHMASKHPVTPEAAPAVEENLPPVVIKTTRPVEVNVAGVSGMVRGTEITVPYNQAGDIKRRLIEAYGADILAE